MSYGLFEDIQAFDEGQRTASLQVLAAANKRVADQFSAFLANADSPADRAARLALVEDDVRQVVADAVQEYAPEADTEALEETILEHLKGDGVTDINAELEDAPSAVGEGVQSKTADAVSDAGGAVETADLPTANDAGDLGGPSPETDHTTWKPNALNDSGNIKPIDTDMDGTPKPTVQQEVSDEADHDKDFLDQTDATVESQDLPSADDSGQSTERNLDQPSDAADQWTGTEDQVDPVGGTVSKVAFPETVNLEPNWENMRAYVLNVARTDPQTAQKIAESMGSEAPPELMGGPSNSANDMYEQYPQDQPSPGVEMGGEAGPYQASSVDPDHNPVREILESDVPTDLQIEAAIAAYEENSTERVAAPLGAPGLPADDPRGPGDGLGGDGPTNTFECGSCGAPMERYRGQGDIPCPSCGALHNSFGQALAPQSQWGEETGESVSDIYGPDPESLGHPYE